MLPPRYSLSKALAGRGAGRAVPNNSNSELEGVFRLLCPCLCWHTWVHPAAGHPSPAAGAQRGPHWWWHSQQDWIHPVPSLSAWTFMAWCWFHWKHPGLLEIGVNEGEAAPSLHMGSVHTELLGNCWSGCCSKGHVMTAFFTTMGARGINHDLLLTLMNCRTWRISPTHGRQCAWCLEWTGRPGRRGTGGSQALSFYSRSSFLIFPLQNRV